MQTTHPAEKGFSLIELVVVIGVFGILAAASVPAISASVRTARLEGATKTLAADLRHARSLASAQRRTYQVTYGANSYTLASVSPAAVVQTRALPRGVEFAASGSARFYAWGLTESANITVRDDRRASVVRLSANGSIRHD